MLARLHRDSRLAIITTGRRQGASRANSAGRLPLLARLGSPASPWFKRSLWTGAGLVCLLAVFRGAAWLGSVPVGPIEIFGYSGAERSVRGATEGEIYLLMDEYLEQGYWDIDLIDLRMALETHRWIRRASIVRQWPNLLHIQIDEHLPVARWNGTHVLASSAELIPVDSSVEFLSLPQFTTPGMFSHSRSDIELMVDQYNLLQKMLSPQLLSISELGSALGTDIWLVLQDGTRIELGEKNHRERLQRLIDLVESGVIDSWSKIALADLRYAHGLSVRWKGASVPAQITFSNARVPEQSLPEQTSRRRTFVQGRQPAAAINPPAVSLMNYSGAKHA